MKRRTVRIGVDSMLQVETLVHGIEITVLDRNGVVQDLWIESTVGAAKKRVGEVGGGLVVGEMWR